jgi:transportin-1
LSSVAVALGPGFQQFTVPVFKQAHNLIHQVLVQDQQYQQGVISDPPDKEFLVAALDLMSGLVQSMGEDLNVLIQASEPKLVEMLTHCLMVFSRCFSADPRTKSMMSVSLDLHSWEISL